MHKLVQTRCFCFYKIFHMGFSLLLASFLTFVELNCENLFDCHHDSLKQDTEFLPSAPRRWTPYRYWRKLDSIGRAILSCGDDTIDSYIPDFVALCEVENDSVMYDLTKRSLLRNARYNYVMTDSRDARGIDVALLYHDFSFAPINHYSIRVEPVDKMPCTRDILYVTGRIITDDILHIFVVHSPSKRAGVRKSKNMRLAVIKRLCESVDSIRNIDSTANIIVAGDFNEYCDEGSLLEVTCHGLENVTCRAKGTNKAKGTYRYKGKWGNLDHIFLSQSMIGRLMSVRINDLPFLVEKDNIYGGVKPKRTYNGYRYRQDGVSDHLPLFVRLRLK